MQQRGKKGKTLSDPLIQQPGVEEGVGGPLHPDHHLQHHRQPGAGGQALTSITLFILTNMQQPKV